MPPSASCRTLMIFSSLNFFLVKVSCGYPNTFGGLNLLGQIKDFYLVALYLKNKYIASANFIEISEPWQVNRLVDSNNHTRLLA